MKTREKTCLGAIGMMTAVALGACPAHQPGPTSGHGGHGGHAGHSGHHGHGQVGPDGVFRPFDDITKYIAHLEDPSRDAWQKPAEVTAALALLGNEVIADVGAGSGYFAVHLARAVPKGKVYALDVEAGMVRFIEDRARDLGLANLLAAHVPADDPAVPKDTALIFIADVLHHVGDQAAWLKKLGARVKPGTRLAIIEFREGETPIGPPAAMKMPVARIKALLDDAGFAFATSHEGLLPHQVFLEFRKR